MKRIILLLIFFSISGCANTFSRVDFKYSNLVHMNIEETFVDFGSADPEKIIYALSEAFRSKSYEIIDRKKLNFYYVKTPLCKKCDEAEREILQKEFSAYRANNFSLYKSIDRESPFINRGITSKCKRLEIVENKDVNSWYLEVEIPQGEYSTTMSKPDVNSFFLFNDFANPIAAYSLKTKTQTVNTSFASRLYIWAWTNPETQKTTLYLGAKPINGQVVACTVGFRDVH